MAYTLRITLGNGTLAEVHFESTPNYEAVVSAVGTLNAGERCLKYRDDEGDRCSLVAETFEDFLVSARQEADGHIILTVEVLADRAAFGQDLDSETSSDWEYVDMEDVEDNRNLESSGGEPSAYPREASGSPMKKYRAVGAQAERQGSPCIEEAQSACMQEDQQPEATSCQTVETPSIRQELVQAPAPKAAIFSAAVADRDDALAPTLPSKVEENQLPAGKSHFQHEQGVIPPIAHGETSLGALVPASSAASSSQATRLWRTESLDIVSVSSKSDDEAAAESLVAQQTGERHKPAPCKTCSKSLEMHFPGPFRRWICDICEHGFSHSDPMWACSTAETCNWGLCMSCHDVLQMSGQPDSFSSPRTAPPCNPVGGSDGAHASQESGSLTTAGLALALAAATPLVPFLLHGFGGARSSRGRR